MPNYTFLTAPRKWTITRSPGGARVTRAGSSGPAGPVQGESDGAGGFRVPVYSGGVLVGYVAVDEVVALPGARFPDARFPAGRFPDGRFA